MKTIAILNALPMNNWANEAIQKDLSSIEYTIKKLSNIPEISQIVVLAPSDRCFSVSEEVITIPVEDYSSKAVFSKMSTAASELRADFVVFGLADAPLLDANLLISLLKTHQQYQAEYTFAEGYPKGLSCEVLASGLLGILANISTLGDVRYNREFVFEVIKQNINSYDIEAVIAPNDVQDLRLELYCNSKRNFALCQELMEINAENYTEIISRKANALFALPAFYSVEVCDVAQVKKCYLPESAKGSHQPRFIPLDQFTTILNRIKEYSEDAVISLSIFGEPLLHPDFVGLIGECAQIEGFSVLVETSGLLLDRALLDRIKSLWNNSKAAKAGGKLFWVVTLDAFEAKTYASVSGMGESEAKEALERACKGAELLAEVFGEDIYPQFVRMKDNEQDLEPFYRFWKDKLKIALIQKYDNLAGSLPNRTVADLSPIKRNPCWHLKRELYVLTNGDVCACRGKAATKRISGNILTESLQAIRDKIFPLYVEHVAQTYNGQCENCDEYYTFNF